MGRGITSRVIFKGVLTLDTPFHIGSGRASAETDALLLRDGNGINGTIFIPGTSISGLLRSNIEHLIGYAVGHEEVEDCECSICNLFGRANKGASRIVVEDAYPTSSRGVATPEYRDGVAISRDTQTARKGAKYDQETLSAGSAFDFELSVDLNDDVDLEEMKKILYIGFEELYGGRIHIGGSTTRGLGRCHLEIANIYTLNFQETDCLIPFLKQDDLNDIPDKYIKKYTEYFEDVGDALSFKNELKSNIRLELDFEIILKDVGGLLVVKDGRYAFGDDPDIRFVSTKKWSDTKSDWIATQFIPGGSLKGPLRNRAEQIIRTLIPDLKSACDPTDPKTEGGCGKCVVCELFGYSKKANKVEDEKGLKGRLSLEDAYPIAGKEIQEKKLDFVAIDRFTGGALDKAKFNARIATGGCFKSQLILNGVEVSKLHELALIAHLFKDLYLKDIRLGYGKYKGFGKVKGILREIRLLQTQEDDGLISDLDLKNIFPKTNGYWHNSGIWHVLTIPAEEFRSGSMYKLLPEDGNLRTIIDRLDTAFNEFIAGESVRIKGEVE